MSASINEVLTEGWFGEVGLLASDQLRAKRDTCRRIEASISYERRVIQGQLDIVRAEAARRSDAGTDVAAILENLAAVLGGDASHESARGDIRAAPVVAPEGDIVGEHLGDIADVTTDELEAISARLAAREAELSRQRRALFDLIDRAQDEIARRYKSGAALVTDVIDERL